jgi:hypothetical protein
VTVRRGCIPLGSPIGTCARSAIANSGWSGRALAAVADRPCVTRPWHGHRPIQQRAPCRSCTSIKLPRPVQLRNAIPGGTVELRVPAACTSMPRILTSRGSMTSPMRHRQQNLDATERRSTIQDRRTDTILRKGQTSRREDHAGPQVSHSPRRWEPVGWLRRRRHVGGHRQPQGVGDRVSQATRPRVACRPVRRRPGGHPHR